MLILLTMYLPLTLLIYFEFNFKMENGVFCVWHMISRYVCMWATRGQLYHIGLKHQQYVFVME